MSGCRFFVFYIILKKDEYMEITLRRRARRDGYTIGRLLVDGAYQCDTLEDRDRGLT